MRYAAVSDKGARRSSNEDAYLAIANVFAVADGMGGHLAGEVASGIAIDGLKNLGGARITERALLNNFKRANSFIYERAKSEAERQGMGTTLTACAVNDGALYIAHVGDSRLYRMRAGRLKQLTKDHSLVAQMIDRGHLTPEEAADHPQRSVITRALGAEADVKVDVRVKEMAAGDRYLLATDGLTAVVSDDEIASILAGEDELEEIARKLVDLANERGAPDNVTVVVFEPDDLKPAKKSGRWLVRGLALFVAAAALIVFMILAARQYILSSVYLGTSDGKVAIYRGLPGDFAGFRMHSVIKVSGVEIERLPKPYRERLERGMPVGSIEEADKALNDYKALVGRGR